MVYSICNNGFFFILISPPFAFFLTLLEYFANNQIFSSLSAPKAETIIELFNVAEIPRTRFAVHANRSDLIMTTDLVAEQYLPILDDEDWLNLKEICTN